MSVTKWFGFRRPQPSEIPAGWEVKQLRDVASFAGGGRLGLTMSNYIATGYDAYTAEGCNGKVAEAEFEGPAVIVSSIGSLCGKSFLANGKFTTLANVQVVFPDKAQIDAYFLWLLLNDAEFWVRGQTGQPFIRPSEFKRSDFDAELYAAKTRKLIRECAKLKSFLGHLPEIAIDERYLENLRYSKMSDADKAEKIIRDIETVIRREEARNPVYVDLDARLQELIERKRDLNQDIEQILADLEKLYGDIEQVGLMPQRKGFEDRGRFDLFLDIEHATGAAFDETKARQFVDVLVAGLAKSLYAAWQESDLKCKDVVTDIRTLADGDDFASLGISDNADLVETLLKRLVQHYAIE